MYKWPKQLSLALGVLYLLVSLTFTNVKAKNQIAQQADEGFLHPYEGKTFYWTNGNGSCHKDGWGKYVGGIPSTCAVDFTHYPSGEKINCGEPAMAPVSGEFTPLGNDGYNNPAAVLKGTRYWVFFLHGEYVPAGYLKQGDIFGYENTHGNSTACHWHMTVFDTTTNSWVNPKTLQSVGVPAGAGAATLDTAQIQADLPHMNLLPVSDGFQPIILTPTPTAPAITETPPSQPSQGSPDLMPLVILLGAILLLSIWMRQSTNNI